MKFAPCFDLSRPFLWMSLLVVTLLISAPLYAGEAAPVSGGTIEEIDIMGRVIKIDGTSYTLALQAEIKDATSDPPKAMRITELQVGQYVNFEASNKLIHKLSAFLEGQNK
jgi:hypothetical protein